MENSIHGPTHDYKILSQTETCDSDLCHTDVKCSSALFCFKWGTKENRFVADILMLVTCRTILIGIRIFLFGYPILNRSLDSTSLINKIQFEFRPFGRNR